MCGDVGRCAEMWGDVGRCGEMWVRVRGGCRHLARRPLAVLLRIPALRGLESRRVIVLGHRQLRRYGEMWGDVGRCGEMWGHRARSSPPSSHRRAPPPPPPESQRRRPDVRRRRREVGRERDESEGRARGERRRGHHARVQHVDRPVGINDHPRRVRAGHRRLQAFRQRAAARRASCRVASGDSSTLGRPAAGSGGHGELPSGPGGAPGGAGAAPRASRWSRGAEGGGVVRQGADAVSTIWCTTTAHSS